jgi:lipopolysaccharide export system protein LptC
MTAEVAVFPNAARRERGMERWRARSRLIHRLRYVLPTVMAAILLLLAGWVIVGAILARLGDTHPAGQALIHMTNAHFFGRDNSSRPYILSAAEASRDDKDLQLVTLQLPTLTLSVGTPQSSKVSADAGVYREDNRVVRLWGHVALQTASGNLFRTDQALVDTVRGTVHGPSAVSGVGPSGEITAHAFDVYDRGARVVFRGEVHSRMKRD